MSGPYHPAYYLPHRPECPGTSRRVPLALRDQQGLAPCPVCLRPAYAAPEPVSVTMARLAFHCAEVRQ